MNNREIATAIGLAFLGTSLAAPLDAQNSDMLKGLVGAIAKEVVQSETKNAPASAAQQNAATTRDEIRRIQEALNRKGYPAGPADGIAGKKTRAAIRTYQIDNGWSATGILTRAQRARLFNTTDSGAAAVATGLLPLILDGGGRQATGAAADLLAVPESGVVTSTGINQRQTLRFPSSISGAAGTENSGEALATDKNDLFLLERKAAISSQEISDNAVSDDLSRRRQQRMIVEEEIAVPTTKTDTGTTVTATRGEEQIPDASSRAAQRKLQSLLDTSSQQPLDETAYSTDLDRTRATTSTMDETTVQQRRAQRLKTGASDSNIEESSSQDECTVAAVQVGQCKLSR